MKPVIGLCTTVAPSAAPNKMLINTPYVRALVDAGATPLLIPVTDDASRADEGLLSQLCNCLCDILFYHDVVLSF